MAKKETKEERAARILRELARQEERRKSPKNQRSNTLDPLIRLGAQILRRYGK